MRYRTGIGRSLLEWIVISVAVGLVVYWETGAIMTAIYLALLLLMVGAQHERNVAQRELIDILFRRLGVDKDD